MFQSAYNLSEARIYDNALRARVFAVRTSATEYSHLALSATIPSFERAVKLSLERRELDRFGLGKLGEHWHERCPGFDDFGICPATTIHYNVDQAAYALS
ncbi:hypothetical protein BFJ72_g6536 [Fusarium proliferatum]|uniref:Uncharacterized protein n=1 Tax=Gibberella intermedia TaxID=948311 RepID=A0A420TEE8_GIBIN|nr:hypothetical protein BFJ72_g6536 [Fusarium proliferatum]